MRPNEPVPTVWKMDAVPREGKTEEMTAPSKLLLVNAADGRLLIKFGHFPAGHLLFGCLEQGYTTLGVYGMGARVYDPSLMRFLTPDLPDYLDPMARCGLSPYCYCLNDPLSYADPTGHLAITTVLLLIGIGVGAAIGAGANAVSQYIANGGWDNFNWASFGWSALTGAASGALAMSTLGLGAMIAANGALGAVASTVNHLILGDDFTSPEVWWDIAMSTIAGLLAGAFGGAGAMNGQNVASATSSFGKAATSYSQVLARVSSRGYATSRGMHIAVSRATNGLVRAMAGLYSVTECVSSRLAIALAASGFAAFDYAFVSVLATRKW